MSHRARIEAAWLRTSHSHNGFVMTQDQAICLLQWGRTTIHSSDTQNISAAEEGKIWPVAQEVQHMSINGGYVDS